MGNPDKGEEFHATTVDYPVALKAVLFLCMCVSDAPALDQSALLLSA